MKWIIHGMFSERLLTTFKWHPLTVEPEPMDLGGVAIDTSVQLETLLQVIFDGYQVEIKQNTSITRRDLGCKISSGVNGISHPSNIA